ncbi:unnamed protein product [Rotaria socialis]|uniref:Uncharacterized protein n=1 Tax=Rotaria socialis TaxID=392032 RepID=A0A820VLQ7_9BILA|nr:unnamed protein product [Rotaria socialis]CAF4503697.1 unnamed protein product [Rotaria socialis]
MIGENSIHPQISVWKNSQHNSSETKDAFSGPKANTASSTRSFHAKNDQGIGSRLLRNAMQCSRNIPGFLGGLLPGMLLGGVAFAVVLTLYLTSNQGTTEVTASTSTASVTMTMTATATATATTTTTISTTTTTSVTTTSTSTTTSLECSSAGLGKITSRPSDNTSPWTGYSFNYTVTFPATFIQFSIQTGSLRWYYLDDVSVVDMTVASGELLNNPSFENSTTGLTGWTVLCNSTCTTGNNTGARVATGASCYLSTGNCYSDNCFGSGQINFLRQYLTFKVGHTYSISYYLTGVGGIANPNQQFYLDIM